MTIAQQWVQQGREQDPPQAVPFTRVDTEPVPAQPEAAVNKLNCPQQRNECDNDQC